MLYTLKLTEGLNCQQAAQAIKEVSKNKAVRYAAPYFLNMVDGKEQLTGVSNELVVKIRPHDEAAFKELSKTFNVAAITPLDEETFLIAVDKSSKGNALEAANHLRAQQGIEMATPTLVTLER